MSVSPACLIQYEYRGVAQLARAFALGAKGPQFESAHPDTARKIKKVCGSAPCAAASMERRKALFVLCRELPEKRRKETQKFKRTFI